jgi:dihydrofolate reductase
MAGKTIYYTASTLDGFIADPDDSLAWLFVQDTDPSGPLGYAAFIAEVGALVMGATTYEWVRAHLAESGEAWPYEQPSWVMTHRDLPAIAGADVQFASGDVAAIHADLVAAAGGRDVWVVGGGDLAGQLADAGLLDEVIVSVAPVTLGAGRPLLPRRLQLRVVETGQNGDFVATRYAVEGPGDWR